MFQSRLPAFLITALVFVALTVSAQMFKSESDFRKYFIEKGDSLDAVEGLWKVNTVQQFYAYDTLYDSKSFAQTVALLKQDSLFLSYDMKGAAFNATFSKTDVNKVYLFKILLKEIDRYTKTNAVISAGNSMEYSYELPEEYLHLIFKDSFEKGDRVVNKVSWTKIPVK